MELSSGLEDHMVTIQSIVASKSADRFSITSRSWNVAVIPSQRYSEISLEIVLRIMLHTI